MRHASAGDRATWAGDDSLRPLDDLGRRQSRWLVEQLRHVTLARLVSSPYRRCVQTLEPLAAATQLRVETDAGLAEGTSPDGCLALLAQPGVVASTHGDVVHAVLRVLRKRGLGLEGGDATPKGGLWVVDVDRVRLVTPPS